MTERYLRNLRGQMHRLTAGLAGKPSAYVTIEVPNPTWPPLTSFDQIVGAEPAPVDEAMPTCRAGTFLLGDWTKAWLDLSLTGMKQENVDPKDAWAHIYCQGEGSPLSFVTRWRETACGVFSPDRQMGAVNCFLRFRDMQDLIEKHKHPDVEVTATHLFYSTNILRGEQPYTSYLEDSVVKPPRLPTTDWFAAKGLWRALHEAFEFTESGETFYGFSAVHVKPLRDGTNQASVMGVRDTQAYRRVVTIPDLKGRIAIPCPWAFMSGPPSKSDDILWLKVDGKSRVWVRFPNGVVVGSEIPQSSLPQNLDEFFEGLDGRVDFTVAEMQTLRRALLGAKPFRVDEADAIGIAPGAGGLVIRGKEASIDVPGRGDTGEEILVDPELLTRALTVQDLLSLEFKKGDPEHRIRFTGRDVSVVISTCTQPV